MEEQNASCISVNGGGAQCTINVYTKFDNKIIREIKNLLLDLPLDKLEIVKELVANNRITLDVKIK